MENMTIERRVVGRTDVYIGKDVIPQILPRLRSVFEDGALVVVYENEWKSEANLLMQELKRGGYRTFALPFCEDASCDVPEYIRYVFCVGQESGARLSKQIKESTTA